MNTFHGEHGQAVACRCERALFVPSGARTRQEIAKLREEHANFRRLLDLLEAELARFHRAESPDYELMTGIVEYMTHYPDHFHHPKEDLVFTRVVEREPGTAPAVEELARQHRVLAESGLRLHESLAAVSAGALMPRRAVEAPGLMYVTYYRAHMEKEESELFPRIERVLDDEDWAEIEAAAKSMPDPLFGEAVGERYRSMLGHLVPSEQGARAS